MRFLSEIAHFASLDIFSGLPTALDEQLGGVALLGDVEPKGYFPCSVTMSWCYLVQEACADP